MGERRMTGRKGFVGGMIKVEERYNKLWRRQEEGKMEEMEERGSAGRRASESD